MNPFAALEVSDDEEQKFTTATGTEQKPPKRSHQQRKQAKEAKIREAEQGPKPTAGVNQDLPERVREDPRKKRYHEVIPPKEVPATGHYLDRRSGTGRADRPRKEGGGHGGIGNLNDEINKQKYIKEGEENTVEQPAEQKEPEQPQGITLDEYYRNKGIEFGDVAANKKEPVKRGEVNAEWIKKEKLTVLQTKEDKKAEEETQKGGKKQRRQYTDKVGLAENLNSELFGFNAQPPKPEREPREQREPREHRQPREHKQPREPRGPRDNKDREHRGEHKGEHRGAHKGGNDRPQKGGNNKKPQEKVVLNVDDFPSL